MIQILRTIFLAAFKEKGILFDQIPIQRIEPRSR